MEEAPANSPRLERLELGGIGPFEDAAFEVPPPATSHGEIVIFEGPNGSGKTTLLETLAVLIGAVGEEHLLEAAFTSMPPEVFRENLTAALQDNGKPGVLPAAPPIISTIRRITMPEPNVFVQFNGETTARLRQQRVVWNGIERPSRIAGLNPSARDGAIPTDWAAFAFRGAQSTANLVTEGPKRIDLPPLRGSLSFGEILPASANLGQILVNLYFDRLQAWSVAEAAKGTPEEAASRKQADALQASIDRFARALTDVLGRRVTIEFLPRQRPPVVRFDGEIIPLDLLGEGMRRTFAWLSDLVARLELTRWTDTSISPFDQDFWLLLDEIDQSLHPELQRKVLPALRRLFPNARIYVTTHSPFVVASAPDGWVFPIRPDAKTHRVSGAVKPLKLGPGRSIAWAIEDVFGVDPTFADDETLRRLAEHRAAVDRLRRDDVDGFDWTAFAELRAPFLATEGEARAIVTLVEAPVRKLIDRKIRELDAAAE